mgnify:CR=1 FL=1
MFIDDEADVDEDDDEEEPDVSVVGARGLEFVPSGKHLFYRFARPSLPARAAAPRPVRCTLRLSWLGCSWACRLTVAGGQQALRFVA